MAMLQTSGTNASDLAVPGTYRQDQSDLLLSALYLDPSTLGTIQGGEGFSGNSQVKIWNEESLNPSTVVDEHPGGLLIGGDYILVDANDAAVLQINTVLVDGAIAGGFNASERIQVIGKGPVVAGQVKVTVARAVQNGPAEQNHDAGATFYVVSQAIPQNSDLGADLTRPRVPHMNYLQREDINVNLGSEAIDSSLLGYTPGVPNEFTKQLKNRMLEKFIILNRSVLYGLGDPGDGTAGQSAGNNSTFWGMIPMLSGAYNPTSEVYNYAAHYGSGQLDQAVNDVNAQLYANGVRPDYLYVPTPASRSLSRLFKDQIRLTQDETTRGFFVKRLMTDLGNEISIIVDPYLSSVQGSIDAVMVDSSRWRLCPFENEFMSYITSPSFRDGDAARCVIKVTLEGRNTGDDTGQASMWMQNVSA